MEDATTQQGVLQQAQNDMSAPEEDEIAGCGESETPQVVSSENYNLVFESLKSKIPQERKNDLPKQKQTSQQTIDEINLQAAPHLLSILRKSEDARLELQKPIRNWLLVFVGMQLVSFNVISGYLVFKVCSTLNVDIVSDLLDFLSTILEQFWLSCWE